MPQSTERNSPPHQAPDLRNLLLLPSLILAPTLLLLVPKLMAEWQKRQAFNKQLHGLQERYTCLRVYRFNTLPDATVNSPDTYQQQMEKLEQLLAATGNLLNFLALHPPSLIASQNYWEESKTAMNILANLLNQLSQSLEEVETLHSEKLKTEKN